MNPDDLSREVATILSEKDSLRRVQELRRRLPADLIPWLDALVDVGLSASAAQLTEDALPQGAIKQLAGASTRPGQNTVVVLLHGMLTEAVWQNTVASEIRANCAAVVYPVGYGWFDAIRFLLPGRTRTKPLEKVLRELRDIQRKHPNFRMVVIAHSFSTYLISKILLEHKDIEIQRLLLCGSIIPIDYRWDQAATAASLSVVNEVGTRDFWPVLARVGSWGYGCSGTMGFKTNRVSDRYFDYGHSGFFTPDHVKSYWLPFVLHGDIHPSPWSSERIAPNLLLSAAGGFPQIKLTLITILGALVFGGAWAAQKTALWIGPKILLLFS